MFVPLHSCGGQRTTSWSQFFPSTLWVPGIQLRSSGLAQVPLPTEPSHQLCVVKSLICGRQHQTLPSRDMSIQKDAPCRTWAGLNSAAPSSTSKTPHLFTSHHSTQTIIVL